MPLWPCKLLSSLRLRVLTAASLAATALQCVHCSLEASCLQQFCEVCHVRVFIQLWSAAYASVRRWHVMARAYLLKRERDTGMPFLGDWSPELLLAVSIWSTGPWIACASWNVHWWRCKRFTVRNAISWCSWCSLNFVGYFCKASTGVALPDRVNSRWQCIAQLQGLIEQHIEQYSKVAQKVSLNTMLQSCAQSRRRMTRMTQMSRTTWCVYWCILYTLIGIERFRRFLWPVSVSCQDVAVHPSLQATVGLFPDSF